MVSFKQLFYEKNTFPSDLYHVTYLNNLKSILKNDEIKLTYATLDGADAKVNKDKQYYLSMSYDKYGRYASGSDRDINQQMYGGTYDVIIVMDTQALQQTGKLIDANYWESDKYSDDEREVRYISDNKILSPAQKYIKEVHVWVKQPTKGWRDKLQNVEYSEDYIKNLVYMEQQENVPVFLYKDPRAFKLTLKAKSIPLKDAVEKSNVDYRKTEKRIDRYKKYNRLPKGVPEVRALINLINGNDIQNVENKEVRNVMDRYSNYIQRYPSDFLSQVRNDLHNIKSNTPDEFQQLTNLFKKYKIKSIEDLMNIIKNNNK